MRVLVCVKRVPAPGAQIVVTEDGQEIDARNLGFTVSPHEECAVEEAVQIVEQHGGSSTVLTLGPTEAEEQLRSALAVGADEAVLVVSDGGDWDPISTATALAESIRALEAEGGTFDLIMFGNESADSGGYQVGIRVARMLERPIVSGIKGIEIGDGALEAHRDTPAGTEVYSLPLPAVLGVKEGINLPRYPTLKGRMSSKKKEVSSSEAAAVGSGQKKVRLVSPPQQLSETEILGHGGDAAGKVVDILEELGVLT